MTTQQTLLALFVSGYLIETTVFVKESTRKWSRDMLKRLGFVSTAAAFATVTAMGMMISLLWPLIWLGRALPDSVQKRSKDRIRKRKK